MILRLPFLTCHGGCPLDPKTMPAGGSVQERGFGQNILVRWELAYCKYTWEAQGGIGQPGAKFSAGLLFNIIPSGISQLIIVSVVLNARRLSPWPERRKTLNKVKVTSEMEFESLNTHVTSSAFADLLGFEPVESAPGQVKLRLPFSEKLVQSLGRMHGGALFSLADHASGWAVYSTLEAGERAATLEMKINYIAAVYDEDCIAEARVVHKGRTSIVVEAEIKTLPGRLVAKTLATFIILRSLES